MKYLVWENKDASDTVPIRVYVETDDHMYEQRKVEFYHNRVIGYADRQRSKGRTLLSSAPLPSIQEMNVMRSHSVVMLNREKFERIWAKYVEVGKTCDKECQ